MPLTLEALPDEDAVAARAADRVADALREAVAARGRFVLALSGGRTPGRLFDQLAGRRLDWERVHVVQVDERVAPPGDSARNWTQIAERLVGPARLPPVLAHPMPVEDPDLDDAAARYAAVLRGLAGAPPVLDLVQLGLGADGHTASLVPGDPALDVVDRDVAVTGVYQRHRRMTLTFPVLARARRVLWLVTGAEKRAALARLLAADASIPAARVGARDQLVLADRAAAGS
jgi:6-phosphogluconolactonase